jgi:hypothetical protein
MGLEPVGGLWFEFYDDTVAQDPSSEADREFLARLRARAASQAWACDPADTWAYHAIDGDQHLLRVGVWLANWVTWGVQFDGARVVGGECYHDIPFDLTGPTDAAMTSSGSPESLAEWAGEWFESLVSWPIELRTWSENSAVVHREWVLAGLERLLKAQLGTRPPRPPDHVAVLRDGRQSGGGRA